MDLLTEHPSRHRLTLVDLPVELIGQICAYLCMHCQLPHGSIVDVPMPVYIEGREGQRALACLSRTSRTLKDVAQPILFHYYHTGSIPEIEDLEEFEMCVQDSGVSAIVCIEWETPRVWVTGNSDSVIFHLVLSEWRLAHPTRPADLITVHHLTR